MTKRFKANDGDGAESSTAPWPKATTAALLLVGGALAAFLFTVVMLTPDLAWHPSRDAELRSTVQSYQETGVLLVKQAGTGSSSTTIDDPGPLVPAAWDEDPGAYVAASLMTHLTGVADPYPGLKLLQAILVALPMLWLPLTVAHIFRRARAGYAMVLLPPVLWLVNGGTLLPGTEYGLSDSASPVRVYALYGLTASLAFCSLSLLLLGSSLRLRRPALAALTLLLTVVAAVANLFGVHSGLGIALATGVLWWSAGSTNSRRRLLSAVTASLVSVALAYGLQTVSVSAMDSARSEAMGMAAEELPNRPAVWNPLPLDPASAQPLSHTGGARPPSEEATPGLDIPERAFDDPAAVSTLEKILFVIKHFGAMLITISLGFILALSRRGLQRRALWAGLMIALPMFVWGFVPPTTVMPLLYYFSEISAALGLLLAVSVGALVWSLTSMPAHVRASERRRISGRIAPRTGPSRSVSVVIPCRNGEKTITTTVHAFAEVLTSEDEIVVVENGSTDGTRSVLEELEADWVSACRLVVTHSVPGLGNAYRTGVLESSGGRILLTADDLPFGMTDLEQFRQVPDQIPVAIGSKSHPDSQAERGRFRGIQSAAFRLLREALLQSHVRDSQGTFWLDGPWARSYAVLSHEEGLMWTTELVLAAEQQGLSIMEVPVVLQSSHAAVTTRFKLLDAWRSFIGFTRLAVYKDDYRDEEWSMATEREPLGGP